MALKVVLIVGEANSGKSTLIRSLTGAGNGVSAHPSERCVAELNWGSPLSVRRTLVLVSSLNEGRRYDAAEARDMGSNRYNTVSPRDLADLLNIYGHMKPKKCEYAILCISSSIKANGWEVSDYEREINGWNSGTHVVSHCISLGQRNLIRVGGAASHLLGAAPDIRNAVAVAARIAIGLQ